MRAGQSPRALHNIGHHLLADAGTNAAEALEVTALGHALLKAEVGCTGFIQAACAQAGDLIARRLQPSGESANFSAKVRIFRKACAVWETAPSLKWAWHWNAVAGGAHPGSPEIIALWFGDAFGTVQSRRAAGADRLTLSVRTTAGLGHRSTNGGAQSFGQIKA